MSFAVVMRGVNARRGPVQTAEAAGTSTLVQVSDRVRGSRPFLGCELCVAASAGKERPTSGPLTDVLDRLRRVSRDFRRQPEGDAMAVHRPASRHVGAAPRPQAFGCRA